MGIPLGNRLLDALPEDELRAIRPALMRTPLRVGATVTSPAHPGASLYFPVSGVISVLAQTTAGESVEIAMAGREGMIGAFEALGHPQPPFTARVQVSGEALRLPVDLFRRQLDACGEVLEIMHGYLQCLMLQVTQSAVCNRFHTAEQRLARWLLSTAHASGCATFELTHDTLAQMIGSPRSAVTGAASALRDAGLVEYSRGRVQIRDRSGLARVACECLHVVEGALGRECVPQSPPAA